MKPRVTARQRFAITGIVAEARKRFGSSFQPVLRPTDNAVIAQLADLNLITRRVDYQLETEVVVRATKLGEEIADERLGKFVDQRFNRANRKQGAQQLKG